MLLLGSYAVYKTCVRKICVPFGTKFHGDFANYLWDLIVESKVALATSQILISPATVTR